MRIGTPGFVPKRLTEARAVRRIASMTALARLLGLSASTVTRWEDGTSTPDANALAALADILHVRPEYFLRPVASTKRALFHRSLASKRDLDIAYQHGQMQWLQEIGAIVQHYVDFPELDIPDVLDGASYKQLRDEDIEDIALRLRQHWSLGEGPCPDMLALMERIGVVVGSIEMGTSKLDGLCSWDVNDRPYVLLATDKMCFPRRQMDAAHELAHVVLHRNVSASDLKSDLKFIEAQAFRFASALLLPSTTYPHEVSRPSLAVFESLKQRWRVSIKAQIKRLSDLEHISPAYQKDLYKMYSAKRWNREEPFDREWALSEPRVLRDALELIVESQVRTKEDLISVEFTMSPGDVENLASLPPGWLTSERGKVVQLRNNSNSLLEMERALAELAQEAKDAVVVPFPRVVSSD